MRSIHGLFPVMWRSIHGLFPVMSRSIHGLLEGMSRSIHGLLEGMSRSIHGLLLVLPALLAGCIFDGDLKHRNTTVPEPLNDGWEIDTPENVGLSPEVLASIHEELLREDRYFGSLSFLVIKDGKLVFETYLRDPADRDHYNHIQSATKSVTSLTFGIARDQGFVPSLEMTLEEIFPDKLEGLEAEKGEITLHDLLTMRSGIDFDNDQFSMEMWVGEPEDPVRYILEKPLYAAPGEEYYYRDADPQLVGYALRALTGRTEQALAEEYLLAPLGITDYYWQAGADGAALAAHGLHLKPRDLARIGQLVLDGGVWKGQRIVSEAWCQLATSKQVVSTSEDLEGVPYGYGYYWWLVRDTGFTAWGHGGQFALVVPEKRMVLVQTAYPDADLHGGNLNDFLELVAPLL